MAKQDQPLCVRGVTRRFGQRVALEAADLEVGPGEIVGLVGPNGSGKTTLLKIVAGFLRPHAGEVRVFGKDPFSHQAEVMESARFSFAPPALFDDLSPREHLHYLVRLGRGNTPDSGVRAIDRVLQQVGLLERADDRVSTFSFGMRQRLTLALALLPMPGLLVLDEPTDGLDPLGVLSLRQLLLRLKQDHGVAILLSSHLLGEIEQLAEHLLVLDSGQTIFRGRPSELTLGLESLRLRISDPAAGKQLFEARGFEVRLVGGELDLPTGSMDAQQAATVVGAAGLRLLEFRHHSPNLEDALLARMQRGQEG